MLQVSMDWWLLGRSERKKWHKIKGDRGKPTKNPSMLKLVLFLKLKNSNFFRNNQNLLRFMRMSAYIVCFGVVTCLVTSPIFVEIWRFTLNSYNCYRSYNIYSYLLWLSLEVKCLAGSYSDESRSYSCTKMVTRGPIHKLL